MVVAATGRDKTQLGRDLADGEDRGRIERPVVDLEPREALVDELTEDRQSSPGLAEVREHRKAAGDADRSDRSDRVEAGAWDIRGLAPAEIAAEGVVDALHVPGIDHRPCDRRAAKGIHVRVDVRVGGRGRWHWKLVVDRQAELAAALPGQRRLGRLVVGIHSEAEDVELALPQAEVARHDRVDLDAGQQAEPHRDRARGDHLAVAGEVVVVGQREQPDACIERSLDQVDGRDEAVRACRVGVKVDRRGARRDDAVRGGGRDGIVALASPAGRHLRPRRGVGSARWRAPAPSLDRRRPGRR